MNELAIQINNLSVSFQSKLVLSNISVEIPQNSFVVIFGPNAGGKSTIIKAIAGLIKPNSGEIKLLQNSRIGYVPQTIPSGKNIPLSVKDIVAMGMLDIQSKSKLAEVLDSVGLTNFENKLYRSLSGGEQQRVLVARALISDPTILLLDEVTSGVDIGMKETIIELLVNLKKKMTVIFVTHDVSVLSNEVDLLLCLNKELISHGSPKDALTNDVVEAMYGTGTNLFSHCHGVDHCGELGHIHVKGH